MDENELFGNSEQLESSSCGHKKDHIGDPTNMVGDLISRAAAIETVRKAKSIGQAHRMLVQLPTEQPERKKPVFKTGESVYHVSYEDGTGVNSISRGVTISRNAITAPNADALLIGRMRI